MTTSHFDVQLSASELMMAVQAGALRRCQRIADEQRDAALLDASRWWQSEIEGCIGEMVLSKWLGLFWSGKGKRGEPDVGPFEVRYCWRKNAHLIIQPWDLKPDKINQPFFLVTGCAYNYQIRGWITPGEGKEVGHLRKDIRSPTRYVHQSKLYSPESALQYLEGKHGQNSTD